MLKTILFMVVKMSKNFFKFKRHSLALQRAKIKQDWPEGVFTNVSYKKFVWLVKIKPTNISRSYDIRLECEINRPPRVYLYGENLKKLECSDFPHNYGRDLNKYEVRLCLALPKEFNYGMFVSDTIIPWTVEWLFYYEIWLYSGIWYGGGIHPQKKNKS